MQPEIDPRRLGPQSERPRPESADQLREADNTFGIEGPFVRYLNRLSELNRNPDDREKFYQLEVERTRFLISAIDVSDQELSENALRMKNIIPYGEGPGNRFFSDHIGLLERRVRESEDILSPELQKEVQQTYADIMWIRSNRDVLRGLGPVLQGFFDGNMMLGTVTNPNRRDPTVREFENTFGKQPSYIDAGIAEREAGNERVNVYELGAKYHSDNIFWTNASVGVAQADFDSGERRSMGYQDLNGVWHEGLTNEQFLFTQMVFGAGEEGEWSDYDISKWVKYGDNLFPHQILSWQSMGSTEASTRIYFAIKEALLLGGISDELERDDYKNGNPNYMQNIAVLAEEVKKSAKQILKEQDKIFIPNKKGDPKESAKLLKQKLAGLVVRSGVAMDWGFMTSVDDDWAWIYKESGSGITREMTGGWLDRSTDSATFVRIRGYDNANTGKGWEGMVWPKSAPEFIKILSGRRPDFKPKLIDLSPKANVTDQEKMNGELDNPAFRDLKNRIMAANPDAWSVLEKMIWYQETPYEENGMNIVLPIWAPPVIGNINFLNTLPWDTDKGIKLKMGAGGSVPITLSQALKSGFRMIDYDWGTKNETSKVNCNKFYYHLITIGQLAKFTVAMSQNPNMDIKALAAILNSSASVTELQKRANLAFREDQIPVALTDAVLLPVLIMESNFRIKRNLFSEKTANDPDHINYALTDEIQPWRTMIEETFPDSKDGVKNYKQICLAFFDFYLTQYVLMSLAYSRSKEKAEKNAEEYIVDYINRILNTKIFKRRESTGETKLTK